MSKTWKEACIGDRKRYGLIAHLMSAHPKLLEFLFHPERPELSATPTELMQNPFSSGEKVLIQVAIDIWNGDGRTKLMDLHRLDDGNLRRAIEAFLMTRKL